MGGGSLKNSNASSKKYAIVFGIFALVIVTTGISFAFYTYSRVGQATTTITSGDISFTYEEGSDAILANAFPVSDSVGANDTTGEYSFTVKMNSSSNANVIDYNVYLLDNNNDENTNYFNNNQIKFALVKNGTYVAGTTSTEGKVLSSITGFNEDSSNGEGLVLENQEISSGETDTYKLRIWINDDVNYSNEIDENGTMTGSYNGYKYSLRVKVTSGTVINQYVMGGYLTDNDGNPLTDKTMVVYSENPHYIKSDSEGYFLVENLEDGEHEVYYMGDKTIDELKRKTKDEIISSSLSSSSFTTKSTSISFDNLRVSNFNVGRADKMNVVTLKEENYGTKKIATGNSIQFRVNDISNYTNIYSNNGSKLSYNNGVITVNNISTDTNVVLSTGLGKSTNEMDNSENYVLMISDEYLDDEYKCSNHSSGVCINSKNLTLNVNSKKITSSFQISVFSNVNSDLKIIGEGYIGNDRTVNNNSAVLISGSKLYIKSNKANVCDENANNTTSGLCIYGGYAINNWPSDVESYTNIKNISINGSVGIRNGSAELTNLSVINSEKSVVVGIWDDAEIVDINGGVYITDNARAINITSKTATVNINDYPTYISASNDWGIYNLGTLNINSSKANQCTDNNADTTNGLCVYGFKGIYNDVNSIATINNGVIKTKVDAVYNRGDITINDGEFYSDNAKAFTANDQVSTTVTHINGGYFESFNLGETVNGTTYNPNYGTVSAETGAIINIKNPQIKGKYPLLVTNDSILNICSGKIIGIDGYDISNTGVFNYSSNVIFTDGTNTPKPLHPEITLNPNYVGTCSR